MSDEILDNLEIEDNHSSESSELRKFKILQIAVTAQFIAAMIATVLAWCYIESILGTGPIGSILGMIVFICARKLSNEQPLLGKFISGKFISFRKAGMTIGLSAPIFSVCCLMSIIFCSWGPKEAEVPITCALAGYTVFLFFPILLLFGIRILNKEA